jgi:GNAT superfamily N-acetyltransferase
MMPQELLAAHRSRLRALDGSLAPAAPLPPPDADGVVLSRTGGAAVARSKHIDAGSFAAIWSASEVHSLDARVTDDAALAALLADFDRHVDAHATPALADSQATISWPSRDTAAIPLFMRHGFSPTTVLAIRPSRPPEPSDHSTVVIRPIRVSDVPAATRLWCELTAMDNPFLGHPVRPATEEHFARVLTDIAENGRWTWVAEDDGEILGLLKLDPPEKAGWVAGLVAASPIAYLGAMFISPGRRGGRLGSAMVGQAHAEVEAAGIPVTALHYSTLNPLSVPFWHRCGYRPLWTQWARRPARPRRD